MVHLCVFKSSLQIRSNLESVLAVVVTRFILKSVLLYCKVYSGHV